jgi:hypothetical protein
MLFSPDPRASTLELEDAHTVCLNYEYRLGRSDLS